MGRRSSIDQLPAEIRREVDAAIKAGLSITAIAKAVREAGGSVSRAAVGRYTQKYAELAKRQRDIAAMAEAWKADFGDAENPQMRLMVQLASTLYTRAPLPELSDGEGDPEPGSTDWKDLHFMARGLKDVVSAAKIDADREAAIRKNERERSTQIATEAARKAGATPETIDLIKRELLGIAG
jgi:hypothetical protein